MFIVSFSSLLVSVVLLQLGSGSLGPLDVLSGLEMQFSTTEIGLLGSAHFVGFFVGCWWGPRLICQIGHSRAFAVFASAGTVGILLHMMIVDPYAWAAMRVLSGLCVAGSFTVIEAWLQAKVTNETRGRALGVYRVVDMVGGILAQMMISVLSPAHYVSYNILAIICCASLLPLVLTRIPQPPTLKKLRLKPRLAYNISPMATAGVIIAGFTSAGFRMVGALYGSRNGLESGQIGLFLASFILGGALAQYPVGWLADRFDRRWVLILLSIGAIGACLLSVSMTGRGVVSIYTTTVVFGFMTFPIYSVAAAHANDFCPMERMVELSSALLFFFAVGAIISPFLISELVDKYGPSSMFISIAVAHVVLVTFGAIRMIIDKERMHKTSYVYLPRTSFLIGRLLRRRNHHF